jgi:hypothetical protein
LLAAPLSIWPRFHARPFGLEHAAGNGQLACLLCVLPPLSASSVVLFRIFVSVALSGNSDKIARR